MKNTITAYAANIAAAIKATHKASKAAKTEILPPMPKRAISYTATR